MGKRRNLTGLPITSLSQSSSVFGNVFISQQSFPEVKECPVYHSDSFLINNNALSPKETRTRSTSPSITCESLNRTKTLTPEKGETSIYPLFRGRDDHNKRRMTWTETTPLASSSLKGDRSGDCSPGVDSSETLRDDHQKPSLEQNHCLGLSRTVSSDDHRYSHVERRPHYRGNFLLRKSSIDEEEEDEDSMIQRRRSLTDVEEGKANQRRKVSVLVDRLLLDIYGKWYVGRRRSTTSSAVESDYCSTSGASVYCWRTEGYQPGKITSETALRARLFNKSVAELRALVSTLQLDIQYLGSRLVKHLKRRERCLMRKDIKNGVITAHLQALSERRSQDTKMRFSVVPYPGDSGFNQWHDAMKMVARLPGGIPAEFRRRLWLTLAEKHLQDRGVDWNKMARFCFNEWSNPDDEELGVQIVKDLHRTGCSLFCGAEAEGNQALLKRVLLAYARWNKAVGYCQGFNMLAALILQVMDRSEADSVKVMIYLIEGVLPESYFANNLRGLSVDMAVFRDLLRLRLPTLSRHLEQLQHDARDTATGTSYEPPLTNVFTMQWFLTLFSNCLPQVTVLRVWDLIFLEGNEVLLRTALAIWDGLADRIMAVTSADEFYSIMGVLTREMLEFGLMDTNNLVKTIVTIAPFPFPELPDLRDKYLYNITPWTQTVSTAAKRGLRLFYSDDDEETDEDDEKIAIATAYGISAVFRPPRRRDSINRAPSPTTSLSSFNYPATAPDREKLALDISALKQQYAKLRERQRQAHIILTAACARQSLGPSAPNPVAMNHLLLGKSALLSVRGRRGGPLPGAVPPPALRPANNKTSRAKTNHATSQGELLMAASKAVKPHNISQSGETLHWKDTRKQKNVSEPVQQSAPAVKLQDETLEISPVIVKVDSPSIDEDCAPMPPTGDPQTPSSVDIEDISLPIDDTNMDDNSSTSTELCDEPDRLSDFDSEEQTSISEASSNVVPADNILKIPSPSTDTSPELSSPFTAFKDLSSYGTMGISCAANDDSSLASTVKEADPVKIGDGKPVSIDLILKEENEHVTRDNKVELGRIKECSNVTSHLPEETFALPIPALEQTSAVSENSPVESRVMIAQVEGIPNTVQEILPSDDSGISYSQSKEKINPYIQLEKEIINNSEPMSSPALEFEETKKVSEVKNDTILLNAPFKYELKISPEKPTVDDFSSLSKLEILNSSQVKNIIIESKESKNILPSNDYDVNSKQNASSLKIIDKPEETDIFTTNIRKQLNTQISMVTKEMVVSPQGDALYNNKTNISLPIDKNKKIKIDVIFPLQKSVPNNTNYVCDIEETVERNEKNSLNVIMSDGKNPVEAISESSSSMYNEGSDYGEVFTLDKQMTYMNYSNFESGSNSEESKVTELLKINHRLQNKERELMTRGKMIGSQDAREDPTINYDQITELLELDHKLDIGRRNSERALKIIRENFEILHRISQCQGKRYNQVDEEEPSGQCLESSEELSTPTSSEKKIAIDNPCQEIRQDHLPAPTQERDIPCIISDNQRPIDINTFSDLSPVVWKPTSFQYLFSDNKTEQVKSSQDEAKIISLEITGASEPTDSLISFELTAKDLQKLIDETAVVAGVGNSVDQSSQDSSLLEYSNSAIPSGVLQCDHSLNLNSSTSPNNAPFTDNKQISKIYSECYPSECQSNFGRKPSTRLFKEPSSRLHRYENKRRSTIHNLDPLERDVVKSFCFQSSGNQDDIKPSFISATDKNILDDLQIHNKCNLTSEHYASIPRHRSYTKLSNISSQVEPEYTFPPSHNIPHTNIAEKSFRKSDLDISKTLPAYKQERNTFLDSEAQTFKNPFLFASTFPNSQNPSKPLAQECNAISTPLSSSSFSSQNRWSTGTFYSDFRPTMTSSEPLDIPVRPYSLGLTTSNTTTMFDSNLDSTKIPTSLNPSDEAIQKITSTPPNIVSCTTSVARFPECELNSSEQLKYPDSNRKTICKGVDKTVCSNSLSYVKPESFYRVKTSSNIELVCDTVSTVKKEDPKCKSQDFISPSRNKDIITSFPAIRSSTLVSPTHPSSKFNPFPLRASLRQPKELGVKLGLYVDSSKNISSKKT